MKRASFCIAFCTLATVIFCQNQITPVIKTSNYPFTKATYSIDNNGDKQGKYAFYAHEEQQVSGQYVNNKKEGKWTYSVNFITIKGEYKNDKKEGKWIYLSKEDTLSILSYTNGMSNGQQMGYYKKGKLQTSFFTINDTLVGEYKNYNKKGLLVELSFFEPNSNKTVSTYYSEQGTPTVKLTRINDIPLDLEILSNEPSETIYSGNLKHGTGNLIRMDKRGNKLCEWNYVDSLQHGKFILYNRNKVLIKGQYTNNYIDGTWQFFDNYGKFVGEKKYDWTRKQKFDNKDHVDLILDDLLKRHIKAKIVSVSPQMESYIIKCAQNSETCDNNSVHGKAETEFNINETGEVSNISITKSGNPTLSDESIKILQMAPLNAPYFHKGIPSVTKVSLPISFLVH